MKRLNLRGLKKRGLAPLTAVLAMVFLLMAALAVSFPGRPAAADSGYTLPPSTSLNAVAYGSGVYVVAGGGTLLTSTDGATWTLQSMNCAPITDIAYGNNLFVAVGGGPILTSSDGVHWNPDSAASGVSNIVYGNGRFVNGISTSTDGMNWMPTQAPLDPTKLIFGNGLFVDFAGDGTRFATSPDGVNWQVQDTGVLNNYDDYQNILMGIGNPTVSVAGVAYGNGMYVAVGMFNQGGVPQGTNPIVITSPDAVNWTMKTLPYTSYYDIRHITFGNGIFVAVDKDGDILTSPDGITWTVQDTGARGNYESASWVSGATINTWDSGEKVFYTSVSFCGNKFVALGGVTISTSPDGVNWTNQQSNPSTFPAQTPVKFVVGRAYYYLGSKESSVPMMDATPYIDNNSGRALVPVRYLAIALGAITYWDANTQTITITNGSTTISMVIGSTTLTVNGQTQTMDVAPAITAGRTYLPARWVAEALGFTVSWDANSQTVTVSQGG